MFKKTTIFLMISSVLLQGCVSQSYKDAEAINTKIAKQIDELRPSGKLANVVSINRPPINPNPTYIGDSIAWLNEETSIDVRNVPLSAVIDTLLADSEVNIVMGNDINQNIPITLKKTGSRKEIINALSNQTGYGFSTSHSQLNIQRFVSKTFVINLPTGTMNGQQGSQGQQKGEGESATTEGQFVNVTYDAQNTFEDIATSVRSLLKKDDDDNKLVGDVQAVKSMGSIIVRTTPTRMAQVENVIDTFQQELSKQVLLEIQVLEFRSNKKHESGIDWSLAKEMGAATGTLKFLIPGTTATAAGPASGLAFIGTGKWDGTTAFIKVLEQQGTVSTSTPVNLRTVSTQPAYLSQVTDIPYLSNVSTNVTETSTETSTQRENLMVGVDMMTTASVQREFVYLRIAGRITKVASDEREKVGNAALRFIASRKSDLNFVNKLRYGQTVVIGSIKQTITKADRSSAFNLDGLGMQSTDTESVETLILLTPRRIQ